MPPWFADPKIGHFINDARLSDEEKRQICAWVDAGCPEGDQERSARAAAVCRGLEHSAAGPGRLDGRQAVQGAGRRRGRLPVLHGRSRLHRGQVDGRQRSPAGQSRGGASHHRVRAVAQADEVERLRGSLLAAYAPGTPPRMMDRWHGQADSGRLEARVPDALHAQRHAAGRPEHARPEVLRARAKSTQMCRERLGDQRRVRDSARREGPQGRRRSIASRKTRCC